MRQMVHPNHGAFFFKRCDMKKYARHMTMEDRKIIEKMYKDGSSVVEIAEHMERNTSCIYRELNHGVTGRIDKNGNPEYSAAIADGYAAKARSNRGRPRNAKRLIQHH